MKRLYWAGLKCRFNIWEMTPLRVSGIIDPHARGALDMVKRSVKENTRKDLATPLDMRNRLVLFTTFLAALSLLRYCHLTVSKADEDVAPSLESLQVDSPFLSRGVNVQNLVDDRQNFISKRGSDTIKSNEQNLGGSLDRLLAGKDVRGQSRALCEDRYIYIHTVPREFNEQLLEECHTLKDWSDMCAALSNAGLGPSIKDAEQHFTRTGWYETNQFALEVIFHNRLKQYDCLTKDASKATAIYVPYYAGLEASRTLWNDNLNIRDAAPLSFAEWVQSQPEWKAHDGHDHFMVGGRITWDFRRESDWGNKLLKLPPMQNMTTLLIEASPWDANDAGIPYPTYFHPSSDSETRAWQEKVKTFERKVLFSFAGGNRNDKPRSIRGQLIDQCRRSPLCKFLNCDGGACQSPQPVMKLFQESVFCLQPQGDSATRKSIFDSMLAGCIPVFFHADSYSEYTWHFPKNQSDYSVYIPEEHIRSGVLSVESLLRRISAKDIRRMRDLIIGLIPNLVYADPRVSILEETTDAFSIAMKGVLSKISRKTQLEMQ